MRPAKPSLRTPVPRLPDDAFPFLSTAERDRLCARGHERRYEPGEAILREREYSRAIYVLMSGRVAVQKDHLGLGVVVDELRPGAVFGEVSYLDGSPTSAAVVAREQANVLILEELDELLASDPALASGFYRSLAALLARRLRFTTQDSVATALIWG
jgi:extracellular factor (EF) 3-hydroxypalmitic acid methyl ester biosynthesis protein